MIPWYCEIEIRSWLLGGLVLLDPSSGDHYSSYCKLRQIAHWFQLSEHGGSELTGHPFSEPKTSVLGTMKEFFQNYCL